MPPSSDNLPGRTKPAPKRARNSGYRRGKQQGAKGNAVRGQPVDEQGLQQRVDAGVAEPQPRGCR